MIKYQEKIQDFYKMRDTLIAEGYSDIESLKTYEKVELREIALEIIKEKAVNIFNFIVHFIVTNPEYEEYRYYEDNFEKYDFGAFLLTKKEFNLVKEVLL